MLDEELKPWLVEVNASPSLSATTSSDRDMKSGLIKDVLDIVIPENNTDPITVNYVFKQANLQGPCRDQGDFVVLFDEAEEKKGEKEVVEKRGGRSWK